MSYCTICKENHDGTACPSNRPIYLYELQNKHAAAIAERDEQIDALTADRDRLRKELWKIDKTLTGSSCSYCRRVHDILHKALAAQLLDDTLKYAKDTQARLRQEGVRP